MNQIIRNESGNLLAPQVDYVLLDGSGSMMSKWQETLLALDSFAWALQKSNLNSHIILQVFDTSDICMIQRDCVLRDWQPVTLMQPFTDWGGTPLYDAINMMGRRMKELSPSQASILIMTDGKETSSRHTDATQAKAILDYCRARGWKVTFFGCDFNNTHQARLLGADESNCIGVQKALLTDAAKALASKRIKHGLYGQDIGFTGDEKTEFGGYLTSQTGC